MKIISANWREIRVQCVCGNVISVTLGTLRVQCKCGKEEYMLELQDKKLNEYVQGGKADSYLRERGR